MKIVLILLLICFSGCGDLNRKVLDKVCLEGHAYWSFSDPGMYDFAFAPMLTDDGKPVLCNEKVKK